MFCRDGKYTYWHLLLLFGAVHTHHCVLLGLRTNCSQGWCLLICRRCTSVKPNCMSLHCAYTCCNLDALLTKKLPAHVLVEAATCAATSSTNGPACWQCILGACGAQAPPLSQDKQSLLRALQQQDMQQQQDMKMAKSAQPPWNTSSKLLVGCTFHCPCHYTTHT